jgi:hypothetical protein
MPRHIAIYKSYTFHIVLQQGKDYLINTYKDGVAGVKVTIFDPEGKVLDSLVYATEWEFLKEWQILRTWRGTKGG